MIHPHTVLRFINDEIGHGVVASHDIPAGTITWVKDPLDKELTAVEFNNLPKVCRSVAETYTYRNYMGNYVLCWDITRYMNHSFRPNCMATSYGFEVAISNIKAGEQLTNDYGTLNIIAPFRASDEKTRRKTVYPDDLLRYHSRWDQTLAKVMTKIIRVEQPLQELIQKETWIHLEEIASGTTSPESIRKNLYREGKQED